MAFQLERMATFLARLNLTRYFSQSLHSSTSVLPFSTLDNPINNSNAINDQITTEECHVLNELSELLPVPKKNSINPIYTQFSSEKDLVKTRAIDGFLSPDEKLRGIFLQKLKGKTAIYRALTNADVELSTDVVAKVVNKGNLGGEAMVLFFNWAIHQETIPKDIGVYHIILKALGRRKFFVFMVEMLRDMRKREMNPNSGTLFLVMDSFVRAHQVSKAIQFFGQLEDFGFERDTESLNAVLQCLCQRSHVGAANKLLDKVRGKVPFNSMTYNFIIGGWSKFGRVSEIERTLKAMVADGFDPDYLTYSYVLEGLGRAGLISEAVEIFDNLGEKGISPNASVYNAMIFNFISAGDFDKCLKYYELMLSYNCEPNMCTYTRIISAFLKARRVSDAIEMFDAMIDRGITPTTGTITSFIESLCSYGPPHAALLIHSKAKKAGCTLSLSAYKLLLMRLSRAGKCGMLLNIWHEMEESGFLPDMEVYEHVIYGLCHVGQLDNAILMMEESLRKGFCPKCKTTHVRRLLLHKETLGEQVVQVNTSEDEDAHSNSVINSIIHAGKNL
ncbi:hypothetical protein RJ640_020713 [Escallonia rubra]|uniref:Pentatricopeptide repeat-containing protein n=1 Tax=Escallonia rubra TaxID=112253 RepID=A0AA88UN48_9ASTE|nr:hypothetical protein RJ640_020713 [Escallonia rubra]